MTTTYVSLFPRVKATTLDSILLILLMYAASEVLAEFDTVPNYVRTLLFVYIFFLYEPLLVSLWGKTLGHHKMDICVRKESDHNKKIALPLAIARYVMKFFLGWLSLLSITSSKKHQALHDRFVGSVVIRGGILKRKSRDLGKLERIKQLLIERI